MMCRRWILIGIALLCVAQVWSKPADKDNDDDYNNYPKDDAQEDSDYPDESDSQGSVSVGPVQFITKSQYFHVDSGTDVFFPCQAINSDDVIMNWMKDNTTLYMGTLKITTDARIERLPNDTLLIRNVLPSDTSDHYSCRALESNETAVNKEVVHQLLVGDPPSLEQDWRLRVLPHEENEVEQGGNITICCEALYDANPKTIIWSREGHRLKIDHQTPNEICLNINNATRHVAGEYQCLIDIEGKGPAIRHLKLRVKHMPEIEYEKQQIGGQVRDRHHYYTGLGLQTNIVCVVHSHPPVTRLQWFKDGHKVKVDNRITKNDSHRSHHVLTIWDTRREDLGAYQCKAWNDLGTAIGPVIQLLDTPDQPIFNESQSNDDAMEFKWTVNSYKPIVQTELLYRKEGDEDWHEGQDVRTLRLTDNQYEIQGRIGGIGAGKHEVKVRAHSDVDHINSGRLANWGPFSEIQAFEGYLPEIEYEKELVGDKLRDRENYYTGLGAETNITCVVHANPPVTKVQWFKDDQRVRFNQRIVKSESDKNHHVLTIKDTRREDLGTYHCKAWNALGNASGPSIHLYDTPDKPIFKRGQVADDAIELQWRVLSYKPIVESELVYRKEGEQEWLQGSDVKVVSSLGKEHIVQGRLKGIEAGKYEALLRSRNDEQNAEGVKTAEWGPFSEPYLFDGEYKGSDEQAASTKGSSARSTASLLTLLLIIAPLTYSCL